MTDPEGRRGLVAATVERFGALDIVVANAGGPPPGRALELDDAALEAAFNANLLTSVRLVREALPHMRASGWGRICCIASYTVVQPAPGLSLSNTARTGLRAWSRPRPRTWPPSHAASPSTWCVPAPTPRTA